MLNKMIQSIVELFVVSLVTVFSFFPLSWIKTDQQVGQHEAEGITCIGSFS